MKGKQVLVYFILIASCFLVYANSLHNAFVSDDIPVIVENAHREAVLPYWSSPADMLYSLNYRMGHLDPFVYHLTNLILHALNTILVYIFLRLLFSTTASMIGALLFGVHPIHTEAVTWISGRPYEIIGMSLLVGYILYQYALNREATGGRVKAVVYGTVVGLYQYFLISFYPFWMLFPILLVVSDVTFGKWRKNWKYWIPFFLLLFIRGILLMKTILTRISSAAGDTGISGPTNPLYNMSYTLFHYAKLLFWPANLTLFHEPNISSLQGFRLGLIFLTALGLYLLITYKKYKELFFGLAIFIIFLAPSYSPWIVCSLIAERYSYFASIVVAINGAYGFSRWTQRGNAVLKRRAVILFSLFLLAYGVKTVLRNEDWKTPLSFWRATAAVSTESHRAHNNFGEAYCNKGDYANAIVEFRRALALNGRNVNAMNNLGVAYHAAGDTNAAISVFKQLLDISGGWANAYYNLGNIYRETGNYQSAVLCFQKTIEKKPDFVQAYNNLGSIYAEKGEKDAAITMFQQALHLDPRLAGAYYNLGNQYLAKGDIGSAIDSFTKAVEINPAYTEAYYNLGVAYAQSGNKQEAVAVLKKVIQINPGYPPAYSSLGDLYLADNNMKDALAMFKKSVEYNPGDAAAYMNIGIIYTNLGQTEESINAFNSVIALEPGTALAYFNLAVVYFNDRQFERAQQYAERAQSLGYAVPEEFKKAVDPANKTVASH